MKKRLIKILATIIGLYIVLCGLLYFFQEKLIFFPQKLHKDYKFEFAQNFEEINVKTTDGELINGLLFKSENSKGLIFYLHGNAGSLSSWGEVAKTYTDLNYDVFIFDYKGYGKSEGNITGQNQFFKDNQIVYNLLKKRYSEDKIIVLGYSIGTGLAAKLASTNKPKLLLLQAPYYNLTDMMKQRFSFIPTFILKYKLETNEYLKNCKMPVVIFHGNRDEVIYYGSSLKLKDEFKPQDTLITLNGQGHNEITDNEDYKSALKNILMK
ncbi:alpha/beta hydrolase [Pedobacter punctiformis]|uniref:Alpha/beta fold hydrolase n=1 Tax=Pedobacter punctiformis TaxID=3004097 RepID=A0ABT4L879_9SPHI|nr:alpha/beta fold hydrolase [Pedobacter sp. HCMS5-2]MCZ4244123.1 alpha/beta fold hydrolase [Pedobacter sp. HCMS5-2]